MRPHKMPAPLRIALLALPLAIVTVPAAPANDLYRLESRISYLEGQIRDLRMQRPMERQSTDTATDRRLRTLETEIVAQRSQINALENRIAELGGKRAPAVVPPPGPAKPDAKQ